MGEKTFNVLFLCTGNSARSIMAEAILNSVGANKFKAYSAGSHPAGHIQSFALDLIKHARMKTDGLRSKDWEEFGKPGAPEMHFVITVCDHAAREACPVWPGKPMTAHWGVPDPVAVHGSDEQKRKAFSNAFHLLGNRIRIFASLPLDKLDRLALKKKLDEIGQS